MRNVTVPGPVETVRSNQVYVDNSDECVLTADRESGTKSRA